MSWSRQPGRRRAGSIWSGLFVAPMMKTFFLTSDVTSPASSRQAPQAGRLEAEPSRAFEAAWGA
ncbi:hypothetical protein OH76DRAFT_1536797 [Lentinus brumalis]|uniref:Uncharacterized protein n=1 Tax=Lentinus brumalis TaxID=2498619 RepID=A0A371CGF2_9APHY|nr:hypothetical protein OH76DRAFT_1536797 [Polyporus brumalis]